MIRLFMGLEYIEDIFAVPDPALAPSGQGPHVDFNGNRAGRLQQSGVC